MEQSLTDTEEVQPHLNQPLHLIIIEKRGQFTARDEAIESVHDTRLPQLFFLWNRVSQILLIMIKYSSV